MDAEICGIGEQFLKNVEDMENLQLHMDGLDGTDGDQGGIDGDDNCIFQTYEIKYLGCTSIETKRTEKITSEAIKTVISNAKAGGRKIKSQKRVKLIVSNSGIEVLDSATSDTLMRFTIYKISYCSVDASHDHAFSFVGSEPDPLSDKEKLSCHVFLCPKRKIAHEITLLVARCFENAYQNWRDTVMHQVKAQDPILLQNNNDKILQFRNGVFTGVANNNLGNSAIIESKAEVHYTQQQSQSNTQPQLQARPIEQRKSDNPLIDLAANDQDVRKYLKNTWVSFDDDTQTDGLRIAAY